MASSSRLKPDEKGKINVSVNIRGKLGRVNKTIRVHTNDPQKPVSTLTVAMNVKDELHMKKYDSDEIFSDQCKSCHVSKGIGKKEYALFRADCIMCHNTNKSASSILEMRVKPQEYISKAIREGLDGTSMPGFSIEHGGPLTDEEIESLVTFIKGINKRRRTVQ